MAHIKQSKSNAEKKLGFCVQIEVTFFRKGTKQEEKQQEQEKVNVDLESHLVGEKPPTNEKEQ